MKCMSTYENFMAYTPKVIVPSADWHTDITATLKASDESTLGQVTLEDVALKRNITTAYSGGILGTSKAFTLSADDAWGDEDVHTW